MEMQREVARLKWMLFAGIAFLVSGYFSFAELKFALWGETAEATVVRTHETRSSGRRSRRRLAVEYRFTEAGGASRSEGDEVAVDYPLPKTGKATVEYLPGVANSSRLLGHSSLWAVLVFLGCLVWLGVSGYRLWRQASDAVDGSRRRMA